MKTTDECVESGDRRTPFRRLRELVERYPFEVLKNPKARLSRRAVRFWMKVRVDTHFVIADSEVCPAWFAEVMVLLCRRAPKTRTYETGVIVRLAQRKEIELVSRRELLFCLPMGSWDFDGVSDILSEDEMRLLQRAELARPPWSKSTKVLLDSGDFEALAQMGQLGIDLIVSNDNPPIDLLCRLARARSRQAAFKLAECPGIDSGQLARFVESKSYSKRIHAALNPSLSLAQFHSLLNEGLVRLRNGGSTQMLINIALNRNLPTEISSKLLAVGATIRETLAQNSNLSDEICVELHDAPMRSERIFLARNPSVPLWLQRKLAFDNDVTVRQSLATNICLLPEIRTKLRDDPDELVRYFASRIAA